jgi:hypothetical protein
MTLFVLKILGFLSNHDHESGLEKVQFKMCVTNPDGLKT